MNANECMSLIAEKAGPGSRLGLERERRLLELLGQPQRRTRFVHIAGTNGKGSAAAMLSSILTSAGYRTGLYTSPHLLSPTERIKINGRDISERDFCCAAEKCLACMENMAEKPTEFELITAMAFLYFAESGCDIAVVEVGLGGRLDATNVIDAPEAAAIMNIGHEHAELLGDTVEKIAWEKAAISTFRLDKNIKLATYASRCIENEILMHLRKVSSQRTEVSFDEPLNTDWDGNELLLSDVLGTDGDEVSRPMEDDVERQLLLQAVSRLGEREKSIITLRFGLGGRRELTQKEVADRLGISQSYISRLEKRIIVRLRRDMIKQL